VVLVPRVKITVPSLPAGFVARAELCAGLDAGAGAEVALVCAPAGYGKTTLLSQWAERDARRFAWVALDGADDASTLLECVTVALSRTGSIDADEAHRPDRRPRPARAEAAAIVATAVKARPAEIALFAIVAVIAWSGVDIPGTPVLARHARNRRFPGGRWKAVVRWLLIARQEAVAMPAWRRPFLSGCSRGDR